MVTLSDTLPTRVDGTPGSVGEGPFLWRAPTYCSHYPGTPPELLLLAGYLCHCLFSSYCAPAIRQKVARKGLVPL